ncbi:DUF5107 domain-containing protein [Nakamurella deserti]|uniref:DUF5107 domain-containing protein n=1 Tax=Nakamurella deserti TaxID=2164074 RepID=UPI000DBE1F7A|nr:DUF5107 domain-containing protein [Nakamurella deserti]
MLNDDAIGDESRLVLPPRPGHLDGVGVAAWSEPVDIDTYLPAAPDRYPAFLENRVYQGSSGRVYPLPFCERIDPVKRPHRWQAVHLENRFVRLMILPELGGRIHVGLDRITGYDFFYRNNVIKPALVGLAGPWIAGGVEFNWPQHHRPATFLPTDVSIEADDDGSVTVWCSDHDPMARMKGMHGIRLRPDSSVIEVRVRLYNRTEQRQTFLWWANVAAAVHEDYQSFFPTDVTHVADHAKRAVTTFPRATGRYYGVDYAARAADPASPDADRLDWYCNIPVPTSYMVTGTADDFFGGYDHRAGAGFVHWADRHVAPGKKQWTWGNAPFGWAWDANLTDGDGPYVELMAGAYTDNQPDFSFLAPGETKIFSQFWYPIQGIGPVSQATRDAAVSLTRVATAGSARCLVGVAVTADRPDAVVSLRDTDGAVRWSEAAALSVGAGFVREVELSGLSADADLEVVVTAGGVELVSWRPAPGTPVPAPVLATEPPVPGDIVSNDELYLTGLHLEQYRHATRLPEPYWAEAVRRDPGDIRSNVALGARLHDAGRYDEALPYFERAVTRSVARNPNPADGTAHYRWGVTLAHLGRTTEAYEALSTAAWCPGWQSAAHTALARLDARAGRCQEALDHARSALRTEADHLQAMALAVLLLRRLGRAAEADELLAAARALDPLDVWTAHLAGRMITDDPQTRLDVALEYAAAGFFDEALAVLDSAVDGSARLAAGQTGVAPLVHYHRAVLLDVTGRPDAAADARAAARAADARWCLPSRLSDVDALLAATAAEPDDGLARLLLGSWFYDRRQYDVALEHWSASAAARPADPVVHRNLGLAAYNVSADTAAAVASYGRALEQAPDDDRLWYESDQLAEITGVAPAERLRRLQSRRDIVSRRDDLTVVLARLLVAAERADEAWELIAGRRFQPWEGGEGQVLAAWDQAVLAQADRALDAGDPTAAVDHLRTAFRPPSSLGEAPHLLANRSHLELALGDALTAAGDPAGGAAAWRRAADFTGDFQQMATHPYSEMTFYSALACLRLGERDRAAALTGALDAYRRDLVDTPPVVDYFATSLPSLLLFVQDPELRQQAAVALLTAQVRALWSLIRNGHAEVVALSDDQTMSYHWRYLGSSSRLAGRLEVPVP